MHIKGFQELSLKDWPGKVASIIFLGGCNLRCFYCHNSELAFYPEKIKTIPQKDVFKNLLEKKEWLDGVIITGGEPTIYGDDLKSLMVKLKDIGFKVKLFTNGTNPSFIKELLDLCLVDAISIDIKHAPGKYNELTDLKNVGIEKKVFESVEIIKKSHIEVYFRTTIIKGIHTLEDIKTIKSIVSPFNLYLQNVQDRGVLEEYRLKIEPFTENEFEEIKCLV